MTGAHPRAREVVGVTKPGAIVLVVHYGLPALRADDEALGVGSFLASVSTAEKLALGLTADRALVMSEFSCERQKRLVLVASAGGRTGANC